MGCPDLYYKKILQTFNHRLRSLLGKNCDINIEEMSEEELENEIVKHKEEANDRQFYYLAGMSSDSVYCEVYFQGGNDAFNACIGALTQFEIFIGLEDD